MENGKRLRGRPAKRWLDGVKADINRVNMILSEASRQARSRATWNDIVHRMASLNLVSYHYNASSIRSHPNLVRCVVSLTITNRKCPLEAMQHGKHNIFF